MSTGITGKDLLSEVAFLARELKTPVINETFAVLGDQARTEGWSHEEYLAAVLGRQVASRTANGTRMRIAAAHFPAVKTIEDFSFDHVPAATRDLVAHLATTTFVAKRDNVVLLGPTVINGYMVFAVCFACSGRCCDRCDEVVGVGRGGEGWASAGEFAA